MDNFWPVTFMDYVNIISALGTILALFLSLYILIGTKKVLKIKDVQLCETIFLKKNKEIKERNYFLVIKIISFFPAEIEVDNVIIGAIDKEGRSLYKFDSEQRNILRPYFNSTINVKLETPTYASNFYPALCNFSVSTKDNGTFLINTNKKFVKNYTRYLNNKDLKDVTKIDAFSGGRIYTKLNENLSFRLYRKRIALRNLLKFKNRKKQTSQNISYQINKKKDKD